LKPAGQIVGETLSRKTVHKNRAGGVAQGEGTEFKSQYHKHNKTKKHRDGCRPTQSTGTISVLGLSFAGHAFYFFYLYLYRSLAASSHAKGKADTDSPLCLPVQVT
jgi:hypothetical protein